MPLAAYTGVLGPGRAAHLLRRATFGPTIQQINQFAVLTAPAAMPLLFDDQIPDPQLPINPETGQEWLLTGLTGEDLGIRDLTDHLVMWFIGMALDNSKPVYSDELCQRPNKGD